MEPLETRRYELVDADSESLRNGLGLWLTSTSLTENILQGKVNILETDQRSEGTMGVNGDRGEIFSESSHICQSLCGDVRYGCLSTKCVYRSVYED